VFELGEAVASQVSEVLELDEQLWEPARYRLRLDGDLNRIVVAVDRQKDLAEGSFSDFLQQSVLPIANGLQLLGLLLLALAQHFFFYQ